MSFEINWSLLANDAELNERIRLFLHKELNSIPLPAFIDNLEVSQFSLGQKPPVLIIRHIGDPFEEFYGEQNTDDEQKRHNQPRSPSSFDSNDFSDSSSDEDEPEPPSTFPGTENGTVQGQPKMAVGRQPSNSSLPSTENQPTRKRPDSIRHFSNYNMNNLGLGHPELELPASFFPHSAYRLHNCSSARAKYEGRNPEDIQFVLEIDHQSKISIELKIDLLVNYPLMQFISLPIKLHITDLAVHSLVAVAYLERKVFFSILCDLNDPVADYFTSSKTSTSPKKSPTNQRAPAGGNFVDYSAAFSRERIEVIRNIKINSEIGEVENNVLRNVGKVEKFLIEQLRNIIRDEISWPGWFCFDFNEDFED